MITAHRPLRTPLVAALGLALGYSMAPFQGKDSAWGEAQCSMFQVSESPPT